MSWTKTSKRGYLIATETLTLGATSADVSSSVVDFIPPGKDFVVIGNTGATDLSADADIAVHVSTASDGTFVLLKDNLIATIDAVTEAGLYDVSANGESPYYKIVVDPAGAEASESVGIAIIVPQK